MTTRPFLLFVNYETVQNKIFLDFNVKEFFLFYYQSQKQMQPLMVWIT